MSSTKLMILKIVRWAVTLLFLGAGTAKLLAVGDMIDIFYHFQLPLWFMYLTGIIEILGAIGLIFWNQKIGLLAAFSLFATMFVGSVFHLIYDPVTQAIPAISLAILCAFWVVLQRAHLNQANKGVA